MNEHKTFPKVINETLKIFPYDPINRPLKVIPQELNGQKIAVSDVYQVIEVPSGEQIKVVERWVSSCTILKISCNETEYYFHLPATILLALFDDYYKKYDVDFDERKFCQLLEQCSKLVDIRKLTFVFNGFHFYSEEGRLESAQKLYQALFPECAVEYKVVLSESGITEDLSKAIDITFEDEKIILPPGYYFKEPNS